LNTTKFCSAHINKYYKNKHSETTENGSSYLASFNLSNYYFSFVLASKFKTHSKTKTIELVIECYIEKQQQQQQQQKKVWLISDDLASLILDYTSCSPVRIA